MFLGLVSTILLSGALIGCTPKKSDSEQPSEHEPTVSEPIESETSPEEESEESDLPSESEEESELPSESEQESEEESEKESEDEFIDYVHNGSTKLLLDYKNRDFFVDGIGEVTLKTTIDGDTAHFLPTVGHTNTVLKSRFYGIDTPESTGSVQPFGKKASKFTSEKLLNAAENGTIVISSPFDEYKEPTHDSTGSRYLSLVWINETEKHCDFSKLVLLNLWIVQEGYSWARNVNDYPRFADTFQDAQAQAEKFVLNLWTGYDPDYNTGDYKTTSLLEIKREIALSIADPTHVNKFDNKRVRFTGAVSGYADRILYVQDYCYNYLEDGTIDPDNPGEYAGINVFVGMGKIPDKFTEIGAYLEIVGLALDNSNFGFQITDTAGKWASAEPSENECKVLLSAEDNTEEHALHVFDYSTSDLNAITTAGSLEPLYCRVDISGEVTVSRAFVSDSNDVTLYFKEVAYTGYIPFQYKGDPNNDNDIWDSADRFVGKKFTLSGTYSWHRTTSGKVVYQIVPTKSADFVCELIPGTLPEDRLSVSQAFTIGSGLASGKTTDITYFVEGKIKSTPVIEKKTVDEVEYDVVTATITDGVKDIKLYKQIIDSSIQHDETRNDLVVGATVYTKGQISNYNGSYELVNGVVTNSYPHGRIASDPLTVTEAYNGIAALPSSGDSNENHPTIRYYVVGEIKSFESELSGNRISLTITDGDNNLTVVNARLQAGVAMDDLAVGIDIIVSGRFYHDGDLIKLEGSCYVERIVL